MTTVNPQLLFQYCPKIAVIDGGRVLLCQRAGEADLDGVFTLIGGKMEHSDGTILDSLRREKTEEIGPDNELAVLARYSINVEFTKADGHHMILPHYLADWRGGTIKLSDEYSQYQWVPLDRLDEMPNIVPNIAGICADLERLRAMSAPGDYVTI